QPGLPAPWKDGDVGSVGTAGSATQNLGTYTVKGAGSDIGGTADSFNFAYQSLTGGGSIVAKVTSLQNTNSTAKAGIVIRANLNAGGKSAGIYVTPSGGVQFITRKTANGTATVTTKTG